VTRFHIHPEAITGDRVSFDAAETHHLARVLRLEPGALVRTVDGQGHEFTVRLTRIGRRAAEGDIVGRAAHSSESSLEITLAQGLPKGEKLDRIIRMATELGVARVVPLICERTITRAEPARRDQRLTRWRRIAREAAKQSGRAVIPEVRSPLTLPEWLGETRREGLLLCLWEAEPVPLAAVLPDGPVERASLVVGPEGGLTPEEVRILKAAGAVVTGLGPRILRTETAGPVGLALLQSRYGDLFTLERPRG